MKALTIATVLGALGLVAASQPVSATSHENMGGQEHTEMMTEMMAPGLLLPSMDAEHGRELFASKGCVVCHSINGVGGEDAPPLDAATMPLPMNPFEFAARMWRGAEAMVAMQREELGDPIALTGQELADIIAFVHDAEEQKKFNEADVPHQMEDLMEGAHGHGHDKPSSDDD
jgi:cytochrome c